MTNPTWRDVFSEYRFTASLAFLSENHQEIAECALTVALEAFLEATGIDQPEEPTPIFDNLVLALDNPPRPA